MCVCVCLRACDPTFAHTFFGPGWSLIRAFRFGVLSGVYINQIRTGEAGAVLPLNADGVPMTPLFDVRKQRLTGSTSRAGRAGRGERATDESVCLFSFWFFGFFFLLLVGNMKHGRTHAHAHTQDK